MMSVNFFKKNLEKLNSDNIDLIYNEENLGSLLRNKREQVKLDTLEISKILKVRVIDINFLENNQIENISKNIMLSNIIYLNEISNVYKNHKKYHESIKLYTETMY